jgi:hypothetical protein
MEPLTNDMNNRDEDEIEFITIKFTTLVEFSINKPSPKKRR